MSRDAGFLIRKIVVTSPNRLRATTTPFQPLVHSVVLIRTVVSQSISSVPLHDEIITSLTKGGRLAINPHAKPIRSTAATQIDSATTLLEAGNVRSKVITFRTQRGEFTL
jgi:hypothetical protein